ncbi:MAG TPA: HAMP domain-containing sensor histidine kinase [Chloroflexota bacterium]
MPRARRSSSNRRSRRRSGRALLLGTVAHELRTPLAALYGYVQLLRQRLGPEQTEQVQRLLDVIEAQCRRLTFRINDVVNYALSESGALAIERRPGDLMETVREAVSLVGVSGHGHRFHIQGPETVPLTYDHERLLQVVGNLLDNALKHAPDSQVFITVEPLPDVVLVTVRDTGPGFAVSNLEHLFVPFRRVAGARSGLGLGLYIAREIVSAHGGHLWAERPTEGGALFRFTLPQHPPAAASASPE